MTRVAGFLFLLTAVSAALFLFHIKQEVREMEEELGLVHSDILHHQEEIQVLKTEWSYLNQPARIADLAQRHLGLGPLSAKQFVRFEDLPLRTPAALFAGTASSTPPTPDPSLLTKAGTTR